MDFVSDIMTVSPITVHPTASVANLLAMFDRHDFNAFPVVGQHDRLLGIISKLDVLRLFVSHGASSPDGIAAASVADVMHRGAVSILPADAIPSAGNLMVATNLRSIPVVDCHGSHPAVVGMLSRGDVIRGLRFQSVEGRWGRQDRAS